MQRAVLINIATAPPPRPSPQRENGSVQPRSIPNTARHPLVSPVNRAMLAALAIKRYSLAGNRIDLCPVHDTLTA